MLIELLLLSVLCALIINIHLKNKEQGGAGVPYVGPLIDGVFTVSEGRLDSWMESRTKSSVVEPKRPAQSHESSRCATARELVIEDTPSQFENTFVPPPEFVNKRRSRSRPHRHHSRHRAKGELVR